MITGTPLRFDGEAAGDGPRLSFMHFWTNDDAREVAKGLPTALHQVNDESVAR